MSEQDKRIMEKIGELTSQMNDRQKEKLLAFADGMSASMTIMEQNKKKESA